MYATECSARPSARVARVFCLTTMCVRVCVWWQLGYMLLQHPVLLLPIFEEAVVAVQAHVKAAAAAGGASASRGQVGG